MKKLNKISTTTCTTMSSELVIILLIASSVISIFCFVIHFANHFSIQCPVKHSNKCPGETGFFPICFVLYNGVIIILSTLILIQTLQSSSNDSIVYALILLSIWESLFNFHRFYSTYFASRKIIELNAMQILFKFCIYFAVPFLCIFLLQVHFFHLLYPLIIVYYTAFNLITVWLFGHILIVQYRFVMG